jgi:hypothetical protein
VPLISLLVFNTTPLLKRIPSRIGKTLAENHQSGWMRTVVSTGGVSFHLSELFFAFDHSFIAECVFQRMTLRMTIASQLKETIYSLARLPLFYKLDLLRYCLLYDHRTTQLSL